MKTLQLYKDFSPTCFDSKGAFLPCRQNWIVAPLTQTRDSGAFDKSNFDAALKILGGESETVEVHRFGHWGPGWFEIIIVNPSRKADIEAIVEKLENYPLLDDKDFCNREYEEYLEAWDNYGFSDFIKSLNIENYPKIQEFFENLESWKARELFESGISRGEYYISETSGVLINLKSCQLELSEIADFVRKNRNH
jgi:hypothetical protein